MNAERREYAEVDRLIEEITKKLESMKPVLKRSIEHGRLSWRVKGTGFEIKVTLEM
jgi:hypothetical protein